MSNQLLGKKWTKVQPYLNSGGQGVVYKVKDSNGKVIEITGKRITDIESWNSEQIGGGGLNCLLQTLRPDQ